MATLRCVCGFTMRNNSDANEVEGTLISHHDELNYQDAIRENHGNESFYDEIDKLSRSVWQCGECGRLAIAKERDGHSYVYYRPETEEDRVKFFQYLPA